MFVNLLRVRGLITQVFLLAFVIFFNASLRSLSRFSLQSLVHKWFALDNFLQADCSVFLELMTTSVPILFLCHLQWF
jgi:hypothetical protein